MWEHTLSPFGDIMIVKTREICIYSRQTTWLSFSQPVFKQTFSSEHGCIQKILCHQCRLNLTVHSENERTMETCKTWISKLLGYHLYSACAESLNNFDTWLNNKACSKSSLYFVKYSQQTLFRSNTESQGNYLIDYLKDAGDSIFVLASFFMYSVLIQTNE